MDEFKMQEGEAPAGDAPAEGAAPAEGGAAPAGDAPAEGGGGAPAGDAPAA